jgi:hypothetical protein
MHTVDENERSPETAIQSTDDLLPRQPVSRNFRWVRFIFLLIGLIFLLTLYSEITNGFLKAGSLLKKGIPLLLMGFFFYRINRTKTVEFNAEYMYLTGKEGEECIPLKDVYKIKFTMTSLSNENFWKIGYTDTQGRQRAVRILPKYRKEKFSSFQQLVKKANPGVRIRNWSHSFDFDR